MFSKFFIARPIFATVLAVLMIIAGLMCLDTLPIAQYPDITPPTVMVRADYPGADAETVAKTVGVPIEQQVNGTEGMLYMSSDSGSDGSYMLTITFENGTDVDQAAVDVQNRISMATATLPSEVQQQGISVSKESSNQVLFCALETDRPDLYDALYLTNYAQINIIDPLSRVEGVGGAQAFGGGEYSMRVWLDPVRMRARGITPDQVLAAIRGQNIEVGSGSLGAEPQNEDAQFQFTLTSQGRLTTPEQFGDIVIRSDGTGILRLSDLGNVELGSDSYSQTARVNGETAALIGVQQLPGANAMDVAKASIAELDRLSQYFPEGIHYRVILNTTDFVRASIEEVVVTFVETTLIVMLVILIFLQNWRAVIIPMLTIPVSLIATFAVMKMMGFSLNTLSLFGMVLAIAIVVDDAIVVVEDCSRLLDEGKLDRKQAAVKAMRELTGPVVGEVLVLLSVFIPTAFVSGITGQLYKQFALTIAVSTAFSGFNALTLTPALCALFLKPRSQSEFFLYRWFNTGWSKIEGAYKYIISKMLERPLAAMLVFAAIAGAAIWGFLKLPQGYLPEEDNGYFMMAVQLPDGASLERTEKCTNSIVAEIRKEIPEVKDVMSINGDSFLGGGASSDAGTIFIVLKPWSERKGKEHDVENVMRRVQSIASRHQEAMTFCVNPPSIPGLGLSSGLQMQLLDISNLGPLEMEKAIQALKEQAAKDPRIAQITSLYQGSVPQYSIKIDRDKVSLLGLDLSDIYSTLSTYVGGTYANDFNEFGRTFQVTVGGTGSSRANPDDILKLSVASADGKMTPFSAFAEVVPSMGEPTVSRYNMYPTASITADLADGVSSSDGIKAMEQLVKKTLGTNYSYAWTGEAYQETQSGTTISFVFIFAIVMTILVLAAQYESWTSPIAVVLSMPVAILGTVVGCLFMDQSVSIYTQIGVILLLGMSAKNAILIVEYARDYRKAGLPIRQAALQGGYVRFRPIMMTALAFIFGVMPMMFATGAGAASRVEIGTAVVFGMVMNAIVGTLFVPNFWELMQRIQERYFNGLFRIRKQGGDSAPSPSGQPSGTDGKNPL